MAQIKKIVKPGDAVRGAKTGLAALDKDGLVKSFPIPPNSTGKYLGIDVSNNPGWFNVPSLPAYDHTTDVGKVLTAEATGPEWNVPKKLYRHFVHFEWENDDVDGWVDFNIINGVESYNSLYDLLEYVRQTSNISVGRFTICCDARISSDEHPDICFYSNVIIGVTGGGGSSNNNIIFQTHLQEENDTLSLDNQHITLAITSNDGTAESWIYDSSFSINSIEI
jgi:hypothetical protein